MSGVEKKTVQTGGSESIGSTNKVKKLDPRWKHNWRIDMLAIPKGHKDEIEMFKMTEQEKDAYIEKVKSLASLKLKKSKSKLKFSQDQVKVKRMIDLAYKPARFYTIQKSHFSCMLGNKFEKRMDNYQKGSSKSIYNEYKRAHIAYEKKMKAKRRALREQRSRMSMKSGRSKAASSTKSKKKSKKDKLAEAIQWCSENSQPKKLHNPPKVDRGQICDLNMIETRMKELAVAKHYYKRPSQDSMNILRRCKVSPFAMLYVPTDRMLVLAQPQARKTIKEEPIILGSVQPDALTYKPTERILALAAPKARAATLDSDYNEDAFKVSPNALKYKASPKILELSKPLERS